MDTKVKHLNDLTRGPVGRQLLSFAAPVMLASLLQGLYSIVDMIIVGRFGSGAALSGITNGGQIMTLISFLAVGMSSGSNTLIGQYFGAGDDENRLQAVQTTVTMHFIIGLALSILLFSIARPLMRAMNAPALTEAVRYMRICGLGTLFIVCYNGLSAIVRAQGNSRMPLLFIACATAANVVCDLLFVAVLGMGEVGAAIATVAAQAAACIAALTYILRHKDIFGIALRKLRFYRDKCAAMLKIGLPCALQFCLSGISFTLVTVLINRYGVEISAASGIATRIKDLCIVTATSMLTATATMSAQCLGAELYDRVKKVVGQALLINLAISVALIVLIEIFAPFFVGLFTNDPVIREAGVRNLRIEILGQLFYIVFPVIHGLATGAGDTRFVLLNGVTALGIVRAGCAFILEPIMGVTGVYWSCVISPATAIPLCLIYYFGLRWRHSIARR